MTKIVELNNAATRKERMEAVIRNNRRKEKAQNIIGMLIGVVGLALILIVAQTERGWAGNETIKECLIAFDGDFNKASYCAHQVRSDEIRYEEKKLREYLKENPRYRVPGESLNLCYGKEERTIHTHATVDEDSITWYYNPEITKCNPHTGK